MAFNVQEFAKCHKMHPETESYLKKKEERCSKPYHLLDIDVARLEALEDSKTFGGTVEFEGIEKEFTVPSIYIKEGGVPLTIYRSKACDSIVCPPIVVYFHGGGNVVGCRETHSNVCKILSREAPCVVVNVEYRLAPEHRFPASHDDAKCTVRWVCMNKSLIGDVLPGTMHYGDALSPLLIEHGTYIIEEAGTQGGVNKSVVGVCGDSAGGRLAATVSHELHDIIGFSVLVYPVVQFMNKFKSNEEFADGPVLSKETRQWFRTRYILEKESQTPRASPLLFEDFTRLPPTLMIVAELDPLRDGCYAYYEKLKKSGVKATILTLKGVPHGFWKYPGHFVENCRRAYEKAAKFIKSHS